MAPSDKKNYPFPIDAKDVNGVWQDGKSYVYQLPYPLNLNTTSIGAIANSIFFK